LLSPEFIPSDPHPFLHYGIQDRLNHTIYGRFFGCGSDSVFAPFTENRRIEVLLKVAEP